MQTNNQRLRTRKDLLQAAARLLKEGRKPSMDEVAKEALISRATAYRYFSDIEDLLVEVPVDAGVADPRGLFENGEPSEIGERVDHAEAVLHEFAYANEMQLRLMLAHTLTKPKKRVGGTEAPVRQNRRTQYIEAALAPYRKDLGEGGYRKLSAALALVFGTESMIVFRDVLPLEASHAREVKSWAVRTLARAALEESRAKKGRRRGKA